MAKKKENYNEKVKKMKESLDSWTENGLFEAENFTNFLRFNAKFSKYSYMNRALIFRAMPTATNVATFKAWNDLGRKIKKGEHGIQIFCPNQGKKPADPEDEYEHDKDGNRIKNPDGTDKRKFRWFGFSVATVFDMSQTEGDAIPTTDVCEEDMAYETSGDLCEALKKFKPDLMDCGVENMFRLTAKKALESETVDLEEKTEAVSSILASYCSMNPNFNMTMVKDWASGKKAKEITTFMNAVIKASNSVIRAMEA